MNLSQMVELLTMTEAEGASPFPDIEITRTFLSFLNEAQLGGSNPNVVEINTKTGSPSDVRFNEALEWIESKLTTTLPRIIPDIKKLGLAYANTTNDWDKLSNAQRRAQTPLRAAFSPKGQIGKWMKLFMSGDGGQFAGATVKTFHNAFRQYRERLKKTMERENYNGEPVLLDMQEVGNSLYAEIVTAEQISKLRHNHKRVGERVQKSLTSKIIVDGKIKPYSMAIFMSRYICELFIRNFSISPERWQEWSKKNIANRMDTTHTGGGDLKSDYEATGSGVGSNEYDDTAKEI